MVEPRYNYIEHGHLVKRSPHDYSQYLVIKWLKSTDMILSKAATAPSENDRLVGHPLPIIIKRLH